MAILLALFSAFAYGLSDFIGGLVSRRVSAWPVAVVGQLSSTACTAAVALMVEGSPTPADLAWALLAGIGSGVGTGFLYRGFACRHFLRRFVTRGLLARSSGLALGFFGLGYAAGDGLQS